MANYKKEEEKISRMEKTGKKVPSVVTKTTSAILKRSHPPVAEMVKHAIQDLGERKGSSLHAIKKYMEANYEVQMTKITPFVKRHLKSAVTKGTLVQTTGKGASGSFKLPKITKTTKKVTEKKLKPIKEKTKKKKDENSSSEEIEELSDEDSPQKSIKPKLTAALKGDIITEQKPNKKNLPKKDPQKLMRPLKSKLKTPDENMEKVIKRKKTKKPAESEEDND